jgi:hypothetical protein
VATVRLIPCSGTFDWPTSSNTISVFIFNEMKLKPVVPLRAIERFVTRHVPDHNFTSRTLLLSYRTIVLFRLWFPWTTSPMVILSFLT